MDESVDVWDGDDGDDGRTHDNDNSTFTVLKGHSKHEAHNHKTMAVASGDIKTQRTREKKNINAHRAHTSTAIQTDRRTGIKMLTVGYPSVSLSHSHTLSRCPIVSMVHSALSR